MIGRIRRAIDLSGACLLILNVSARSFHEMYLYRVESEIRRQHRMVVAPYLHHVHVGTRLDSIGIVFEFFREPAHSDNLCVVDFI